jgi:hypothetical protein
MASAAATAAMEAASAAMKTAVEALDMVFSPSYYQQIKYRLDHARQVQVRPNESPSAKSDEQ